jgi:hypothetical protein
MAKIKHVPRWLYTSVVLPPSSDTSTRGIVELEPTEFMNDTIWPWELEHLTFYVPQAQTNYGGTAMLVNARIGLSGQSDVNLVRAPLGILAASTNRRRNVGYLNTGGTPMTYFHDLKYSFRLPKDDGFNVRVVKSSTDWGEGPLVGTYRHKFIALGRRIHSMEPVVLCCESVNISDGNQTDVYAADLMNDGREDVDIFRIGFDEDLTRGMRYSKFQVNPMTGVRWMPGEEEIPLPLLVPYSVYAPAIGGDYTLNQPQAVQFPVGTKLQRRQRVRIQLQNRDATNNTKVMVGLFGYLEVK